MMPYICNEYGYCNNGFIELYNFIEHIQQHILEGDIKLKDYEKFNMYPEKIFQLDMRMIYILEEYYKGLYNPLIHMSDEHIELYKKEIDNWEDKK